MPDPTLRLLLDDLNDMSRQLMSTDHNPHRSRPMGTPLSQKDEDWFQMKISDATAKIYKLLEENPNLHL